VVKMGNQTKNKLIWLESDQKWSSWYQRMVYKGQQGLFQSVMRLKESIYQSRRTQKITQKNQKVKIFRN
jgi:hypothetical protein